MQLSYNLPIEILYTVVPLILIFGFFSFTARDQDDIEKPTANPDVRSRSSPSSGRGTSTT